jgi:hypothetical protein
MALTNLLSTVVLSALVGCVAAQTTTTTDSEYDVLQYVDQLIGSNNGGARLQMRRR